MKKESKEEIMKKWSNILGYIPVIRKSIKSNQIVEETKTEEFPSLLPMAMKLSSKLMSNEIIGFSSKEEIDAVKSRVQSDNRDGKIEAIVEGGEFTEKKLEDDEEYEELMKKRVTPMSDPSGTLFYLDYKYGDESSKTHKKTRRSKRKKSNGSI